MSDYKVYVVSQDGKPLMPTKRFWKVRKLLDSGRARVINCNPFTIQMLYKTAEYTQALKLAIDPGGKEIGYVVRKQEGELIEAGHLEMRSREVSEKMGERKMHRRSRRQHRREKRQRRAEKWQTGFGKKEFKIAGALKELLCKTIKPKLVRFMNRRRKKGWLTPTARHLLKTHQNLVEKIGGRLPIAEISLEYGKFDLQKLDNPEITGQEYQNGRKKGYSNAQEYVLCRDKHTCQLCKKNGVPLEVHHVIWQSRGGGDIPENLVTLCAKCHTRVHKNSKTDANVQELFAGMCKRQVHTTLLNSIMPAFHEWLRSRFAKVALTYGYETKKKRRELDWPKKHHIDAYLISLQDTQDAIAINWDEVEVFEYLQFRRHHRQLIHATRDRNYKDGNKIVAKNRNKRTGQEQNCLKDLVEEQGEKILSRLRVLPGKKVLRSSFKKFKKGDVVKYKGKNYVVKGYGEMGRRLGFVGCKNYVLAKDCRLVVRNKGLVCL